MEITPNNVLQPALANLLSDLEAVQIIFRGCFHSFILSCELIWSLFRLSFFGSISSSKGSRPVLQQFLFIVVLTDRTKQAAYNLKKGIRRKF